MSESLDIHSDRYAITFGEVSILHEGGEEIGGTIRLNGFSVDDLERIEKQINDKSTELGSPPAQVVRLDGLLPEELREDNSAAVLLVRNGVHHIMNGDMTADILYAEQKEHVTYDKKYYDVRRARTLNKRARYNVVFGNEGRVASVDYRQCTIVPFGSLPHLNRFRVALGEVLGEQADGLSAEGNHYYHDQSGIGFHGDGERKIVICASLGKTSTLRFHWRMSDETVHREEYGPIDIEVCHGDVYIMSEKATGWDWRKTSRTRLVHAAGTDRYISK